MIPSYSTMDDGQWTMDDGRWTIASAMDDSLKNRAVGRYTVREMDGSTLDPGATTNDK